MTLVPWAAADDNRRVQRIAPPSPQAFRARYLRHPRPLIVEGLASRWAQQGLDIRMLRERFGDRRVPLVRVRDGLLGYGHDDGMDYETCRLGDHLDSLERQPATHFMTVSVREQFPELWGQVAQLEYCESARWRDSRINIGTSGTTTPIHVELTHNLLFVLSGKKELCLFEPRQTTQMYFAPWSGAPHISPVDPRHLDEKRYPRALRLRPWRAIAGAGDAIFIPRGWWHAVKTHGPTLAVANWWADGLSSLIPLATDGYKRLRSVRS